MLLGINSLLMALLALTYVINPAAAQTSTPSFQGLGQMPVTMSGGGPWGIGVGLDNTIWLTQFDGNKVSRFRVVP